MSPVYIHCASSWDEADEHFDTFMAVVPERRLELAEGVAATRGPTLDRSVESLGPLNEWFITTVLDSPEPPDVDYRPAWAPPPNPNFVPDPGKPSPTPNWLYLLWERVSVYIGDVMMAQVPGARWVCWRDKRPADIQNGLPVIDIGVPTRAFDALACANSGVIRARNYGGRPDPGWQLEHVRHTVARREEYLTTNPPRWQAAPTGPRARRSQAAPGG